MYKIQIFSENQKYRLITLLT